MISKTGFNIIIVVIIVLFIIGLSGCNDTADDKKRNAVYASHRIVELYLKCPSTANYENAYDITVTKYGNNYKFNSGFDAQNSFGASLRGSYNCIMQYDGPGDYDFTCKYLELNGEVMIDDDKPSIASISDTFDSKCNCQICDGTGKCHLCDGVGYSEYQKCSTCNGKGRIMCPKCNGTGTFIDERDLCKAESSTHYVTAYTCPLCKGKKGIMCSECKGNRNYGKTLCSACNGTGKCTLCNGTGKEQ